MPQQNEKIKVLMFGWEFPPHISGGLGTACFGLTKGLAHHNVDVLFVVPKLFGDEDNESLNFLSASEITPGNFSSEQEKFHDKINRIFIHSSLVPYVDPLEFEAHKVMVGEGFSGFYQPDISGKYDFSGKYDHNLFMEVARYAHVAEQIARENTFDVIHVHDWLTYPAGIAASKVSGKPLIVHMHATEFDRSGENINPQVYEIEKMGMQAADKVITVSELTRKTVINKYGIAAEKVKTIHNAVLQNNTHEDPQSKYPKNFDSKIVTFLGRITFQKGPDYFIEAAYKVLQKDPNVHFVMAGNGDMLNRMIKRVAELRIGSNFYFTGFLSGEDVDRMFAMSDVYVMPSVSEPFGISPLEAMRSNVPVIISKQSGVAEILRHAVKTDFWDTDAMADAIYGLLNYKALPKMFKKYGKQEVDQLKWENSAYQVKSLYQTAIN